MAAKSHKPASQTWLAAPGPGRAATVIAEVAQAHDGSLGLAHAHIDAAADAGADAVKFQTHIADAESTPSEPWRARFSPQDESRFDYWKRMEFAPGHWAGLKAHAEDRGLMFLSSPFSLEAVALLESIGMAGWKIASGEITNQPMIEAILALGGPVMLSTGMSPLAEIDEAVALIAKAGCPLAVLQCTTSYPSPPDAIGLNMLGEFRARYGASVGLSDHSGTVYPALAAATLGAEVIEVHITLSRTMFGPDVAASLTPEELKALVDGVRFIEQMRANPVDKSSVGDEIVPLRQIFLKSVVADEDLAAGTVLEPRHLKTRKPGTGIPANEFSAVIGRRLARPVKRNIPLTFDDLEA